VRLGQITEQVIPFHKDFAYSYKELVPMFRPIDFIHFGDEKITFIEVKMGTSQLSEKQRKIRRQVQEGKVEFVEYRVSEEGINVKV
jgi:predicted Holliday junction resolvase-like endonuclease